MVFLLRPVTTSTSSMPAATASSTTYWIAGLSTRVSISLGVALVAGRNRVPRPGAGMTALRTGGVMESSSGGGRDGPGAAVGHVHHDGGHCPFYPILAPD